MSAPEGDELLLQTLNFIGIANQLVVTRANDLLREGELPFPQFVMLSHFMKDPARARTVTGVASAFQAPQPGITKTIQKLARSGFLEYRPSQNDARVKHVFLTPAGRRAFAAAVGRLAPDMRLVFAEWREVDIRRLHELLRRLKDWLDDNRERRAQG